MNCAYCGQEIDENPFEPEDDDRVYCVPQCYDAKLEGERAVRADDRMSGRPAARDYQTYRERGGS